MSPSTAATYASELEGIDQGDFRKAIAYIEKVKSRLSDPSYRKFLAIINEFRARTATTTQITQRVSQLLISENQRGLIESFAVFLPSDHTLSVDRQSNTVILSSPEGQTTLSLPPP